ncbi:MAG: GH3 auxin-responsive promoter family protein [Bacteroidota bacterium]|jgi:hypothetical protein|nr:GH3 auxin-responsive promoter family protein [Sphingobacteriales bacterium]
MPLIHSILTWYLKKRVPDIEHFKANPAEVQQLLLAQLIKTAADTEWGQKYKYRDIQSLKDFKERVPIGNYDTHKPYIERMMRGEQNILWPTEVKWFAKSSGTTSDKSKYIPVTYESLDQCHFQGGKDALLFYCTNNPDTTLFDGKGLIMGGSHQLSRFNSSESYFGDLSAVMMQNLPFWAHFFRTPDLSIAIMDNWDEKVEKMALATLEEDVTSISGVPTWTLVLFDKLFELTGKDNIAEIWPNLELYIHGGVSFTPYRSRFQSIIRKSGMNYLETYNSSEGFLGVQDLNNHDSMLLMLDYGIYYEFMPMQEYGKEFPQTKSIDEVVIGQSYALVITTNAGLCRYIIGDTITFTDTNPFRFKITGRTKHFINAFGEELVIENAENAIKEACMQTNSLINDYTAGPFFHSHTKIGSHEWLIEFETEPEDIEMFTILLDENLKKLNSDYEAKRFKNMAMTLPLVKKVPKGTFNCWLMQKGKLGGQHKIPRLANNREYIDDIMKIL